MIWTIIGMLIGSTLIFVGIFGLDWLMVMIGVGLVVTSVAYMSYLTDELMAQRKRENSEL